jgi:diaminopropionate ammonia-lyase
MAASAGIGELLYKDESTRFGLGSFKALGGAHAVFRFLARETAARGVPISMDESELMGGKHGEITSRKCSAAAASYTCTPMSAQPGKRRSLPTAQP